MEDQEQQAGQEQEGEQAPIEEGDPSLEAGADFEEAELQPAADEAAAGEQTAPDGTGFSGESRGTIEVMNTGATDRGLPIAAEIGLLVGNLVTPEHFKVADRAVFDAAVAFPSSELNPNRRAMAVGLLKIAFPELSDNLAGLIVELAVFLFKRSQEMQAAPEPVQAGS